MYAFYKKRAGKIALLLVLAMLLTGTFAWDSFSQRAFNMAWEDGNYGGRIRDEYDGEGSGDHNKDVFAENFGGNNIFVRVRLREFLSINGTPVISGSEINRPETWPYYQSMPNDVHTVLDGSRHSPLHTTYEIRWTLGHDVNSTDPNRGPKYFMPTHNQATHLVEEANVMTDVPALFAHTRAFQMSEAIGHGVDAIAAEARFETFDVLDMTSAEDFSVYGLQTGPGDGSHGYWQADDTHVADLIYTTNPDAGPVELRVETDVEHTARRTLEPSLIRNPNQTPGVFYFNAEAFEAQIPVILGAGVTAENFTGVMTIQNWNDLGRPGGQFWILDTDGWFYWNGWLPAGEATSLLLDAIYLPARNESWEHLIEVEADFFSSASVDLLRNRPENAMSDAAFAIFDGIATLVRPPANTPVDPEPSTCPETLATETAPEAVAGIEFHLNTPRSLVVMDGMLRFSSNAGNFPDGHDPRASEYVIYVNGEEAARHTPTGNETNIMVSARAFDLSALDLDAGGYEIQIRAVSSDPAVGASGLSAATCFTVEP